MISIARSGPRRRAARDATCALVALAVAVGWRPAVPRLGALLLGSVAGLALIAIPRLAHPFVPAAIGMRPEPFLAWGVVTAVVVVGEEALLRGALFDALHKGAGPLLAVLVTSLAFTLMHVPLYGWRVVPLDLGVGLFLGGLRLASGGVAAPAVAHLLADLSTWWL